MTKIVESLNQRLEKSYDPTDADKAQQIAYMTVKLMHLAARAQHMREGRLSDQSYNQAILDLTIKICEQLGLIEYNADITAVQKLRADLRAPWTDENKSWKFLYCPNCGVARACGEPKCSSCAYPFPLPTLPNNSIEQLMLDVLEDAKKLPPYLRSAELNKALEHHATHGDMDGKTCLLNECVIHYPKNR
jgi:hypothetical protein